jgi:large subunit ribosomal protein L6
MSKIGKKTITVPKGTLSYTALEGVSVVLEDNVITVSVADDSIRNLWGLTRTLVNNMVVGVSEGYTIKLHILWVGFGAKVNGQKLGLSLGFSHPVDFDLPQGIAATVEKDPKGNDIITLTWIDKQLIGETAAKIRKLKKPEPYKGKGIRYFGEQIKLKAGKAAKK